MLWQEIGWSPYPGRVLDRPYTDLLIDCAQMTFIDSMGYVLVETKSV
jgi:hypothetical protein